MSGRPAACLPDNQSHRRSRTVMPTLTNPWLTFARFPPTPMWLWAGADLYVLPFASGLTNPTIASDRDLCARGVIDILHQVRMEPRIGDGVAVEVDVERLIRRASDYLYFGDRGRRDAPAVASESCPATSLGLGSVDDANAVPYVNPGFHPPIFAVRQRQEQKDLSRPWWRLASRPTKSTLGPPGSRASCVSAGQTSPIAAH